MCGVVEALTVASGALKLNSQYQESRAAEANYIAQAQNADQNARVQNRQTEQIADKYAREQSKLDDKMKLARGQMTASMGASGLSAMGSGLDMLVSSNEAYKQDTVDLLQNQRNDTFNSYAKEVNYLNQAQGYRASARNIKRQGNWAMLSTIASTASSYPQGKKLL